MIFERVCCSDGDRSHRILMFPEGRRVKATQSPPNPRWSHLSVVRVGRTWLIACFMESDWQRKVPIWSTTQRPNHKAIPYPCSRDSRQQSGCRTDTQGTRNMNDSGSSTNHTRSNLNSQFSSLQIELKKYNRAPETGICMRLFFLCIVPMAHLYRNILSKHTKRHACRWKKLYHYYIIATINRGFQ